MKTNMTNLKKNLLVNCSNYITVSCRADSVEQDQVNDANAIYGTWKRKIDLYVSGKR
jgi:hypothetical protein